MFNELHDTMTRTFWAGEQHQQQLRKNYIRTGDFCIQYKNQEQELPKTKVRCLSQQFTWFTDSLNMITCLGISPANLGNFLINRFLGPVLDLLPGDIGYFVRPSLKSAFTAGVGAGFSKLLGLLDKLVPPLPLGSLIIKACEIMESWFGVSPASVWDSINDDQKTKKVVAPYIGAQDYGLDMRLNRMTKVYDETGKKDCDRQNMKQYDTDCPTAIPVRKVKKRASPWRVSAG